MSQQQAFLPVLWLGTYSFRYGPNSISFDNENNISEHPILYGKEQTEPTGWTAQKITSQGFFYSLNQQALIDMMNWVGSQTPYSMRPCTIGMFSQDAANSQLWFAGVGYLTSVHFDYKGGYANYKYPFRFQWMEASPIVRIPTSTTIAQANGIYSFDMTPQPAGFLAGVEIIGSNVETAGGLGQAIIAVQDNTTANIGSGPVLGQPPNQLFAGPQQNLNLSPLGLPMPLMDPAGNQSIYLASPLGIYTVQFLAAWKTGFLPTAINLLYLPM
jgi:hypothetical protein